ncbi:MAG: ATP-binding protein [Phaeodactylibacter sp.]|nr:ATP-binding protein [Phaeodactylibacter sp.]MCB9050820.1 ATP-binding protein [Lewinellaceae bacterium]
MAIENYVTRISEAEILKLVSYFPVVAIVGPRQVGKTSLVEAIRSKLDKQSVYLDLENPDDLVKLNTPSLFLEPLADQTVILDEVQKAPQLFPVLRGIIDRNRKPGRFILLGSASPDLIRDTSESLAGRIAYHELKPLYWEEIKALADYRTHWFRGGFPLSLLAPNDEYARLWRMNFIKTYLERDLPLLGLKADPILTGRLWQMTAHLSGSLLNMENLSSSLGIHGTTVRSYLDFFESAYLIRRLQPYHTNIKKRLVKTPKVYIRDTGILHQLLGIPSLFELAGNPMLGASWETYVIEQISAILPDWAELYFYRTHQGTEADLVIARGGKPELLVEIKYSTTPRLSKGFHIAKEDLKTQKHFVICPVEAGFPLSEEVRVLGVNELYALFG